MYLYDTGNLDPQMLEALAAKLAEWNAAARPFTEASATRVLVREAENPADFAESLAEALVFEVTQVVEATGGTKTLGTLKLTAAKADIINRNRRFYSKKVFKKAVERAQALIKDGNFLGEVDHPWQGTLRRAAVRFTKVWMDGALVKAECIILNNDEGKHLKSLIDGGVGVKVSTRGYASYTIEKREVEGVEIDVAIIGDDYTMEGIDFVLFPSNPFGAVTASESTSHQESSSMLTLEKLRAEHADLVTQLEAAARAGYVPQATVETQVTEAKTTAHAEGVAEGKKVAMDEAKARIDALEAVIAAVKNLVPAPAPVKEGEESPTTKLEAEVAELRKQVEAAEAEKKAAQVEADKKALAQKVSEKVEELLKDFAHRELVEVDLRKCATVEAVEAAFSERKALIEQAIARASVTEASGKGTADKKNDAKGEAMTEAQKTELAALNKTRESAGLKAYKHISEVPKGSKK